MAPGYSLIVCFVIDCLRYDDAEGGSQRIIGSFNNAAVGTALGQANGIQALSPTWQVIALARVERTVEQQG